MAIRPYNGPPLLLSGGMCLDLGSHTFATQAPAPAAQAVTTGDDDLSPGRVYAARAQACQEARHSPATRRPEPTDIFSAQGADAVYQSRKTDGVAHV